MGTASKKNTKWIIFGSIIFILAVLIAVGPVLVTKYMRAKWQNTSSYKVSNLLINVMGKLQVSNDNIYYIKGDNGLFYVVENLKHDLSDKVNENCSIICKFREAKNNETIDGNPVRLFVDVQKFVFMDSDNIIDTSEENKDGKTKVDIETKVAKKAKLRVEVNMKLKTNIFFDVIKGKVSAINRKDREGKEYTAYVLTDEFGDNYMLYKKGKILSSLENKEIIVLGREIIPPINMYLVTDESTFETYEVYDLNYNKLL